MESQSQHDLETRIKELQNKKSASMSNIRLEESLLKEEQKALMDAQIAVNRRINAIDVEKAIYGSIDRELAEVDGRLKQYTMAGTIKKSHKKPKSVTTKDVLTVLKGLDKNTLRALLATL